MSRDPSHPTEPEYLGDAPSSPSRPRPGRRAPILGLAAVAVVGVVGVGGWAAMSLMSGGAQPAEAIPANAIGYVSLDLDPSASQKIEAVKILRKFPAVDKEMKISSQDDLRRWVFDQIQKDGQCKSLDYDKDVAPWIGDRIAMAGVPAEKDGDSPTPLVALQVTDQEAASKGITKLSACGGAEGDYGFAFTGDYALISDSQRHAKSLATAAGQGSLADDADFQKWMDRVGEPGIITAYAAPGAMDALADLQTGMSQELLNMGGPGDQGMLRPQAEMQRMNDQLKDVYKDFKGMAGVVRFEHGAVEAQVATDSSESLGLKFSAKNRTDVTDLPSGTAAAVAVSLPQDWAQAYIDIMSKVMGDKQSVDQMLKQAEAQTGLDLPEDIQKLLGDGVAVALDKDLDLKTASKDPKQIPAGLRISGDPAEIRSAIDKVKKALGPEADSLVVEDGDGVVALGMKQGYVRDLADNGGLGNDAAFQDVVPDADRAASAFYVDFDAIEDWVDQGMEMGGQIGPDEKKVLDNIRPLRALGMSSWVEGDGDYAGMRLRLSTD
ncbi:MAG TPA: DUF3352 domain-containing protein [Nocardioidaceae bacterium]|nr:DUF3352 domain-containing protein [Nocardioidaceae bacterium]